MPTFTCAPYQTIFRPRFGAQIAWAESNAIVFANSVIGARTNRYGDFIDLCCAITGRVPELRPARHARTGAPGSWSRSRICLPNGTMPAICCVAVGHVDRPALRRAHPGDRRPAGYDERRRSEGARRRRRLIRLGRNVPRGRPHPGGADARGRLSGRAAGGDDPARPPTTCATRLGRLSTVPDGTPLAAVSLGTPHFSLAEFARLHARLLEGAAFSVDVYVNTQPRRAGASSKRAAGRIGCGRPASRSSSTPAPT